VTTTTQGVLRRGLILLLALLSLSCGTGGVTEEGCFATPPIQGLEKALVSWANLCMPANRFLLIRNRRFLAAFRFTSVHVAGADGMMSCATYETYEREDGRTSFRDGRFRRGGGRLSALESHGVHPLVFQDGHWRIAIAGTKLNYSPKQCFWFPNPDVEMAPTAVSDITAVDAADPALRWFRLDPTQSRENAEITLSPP